MTKLKPMLTTAGVAYVLGCSKNTVRVLVQDKRLRVIYREGNRMFFHADDVEAVRIDRLMHPPRYRKIYRGVPHGRT